MCNKSSLKFIETNYFYFLHSLHFYIYIYSHLVIGEPHLESKKDIKKKVWKITSSMLQLQLLRNELIRFRDEKTLRSTKIIFWHFQEIVTITIPANEFLGLRRTAVYSFSIHSDGSFVDCSEIIPNLHVTRSRFCSSVSSRSTHLANKFLISKYECKIHEHSIFSHPLLGSQIHKYISELVTTRAQY